LRAPAYPCELVECNGLWDTIDDSDKDIADSGDVEDESQVYCLPCEQIRGQRYRLPCIDANCADQVHEHDVTNDIEQGEDRHDVIARDAIRVETSESPSTALVIRYDNGRETECASQVHLHPYGIVGDASGVQYYASESPDDNEIACEDACASQVHWHSYAIVGDTSGVQYSASVSPDHNVIACEDASATETNWRPYAIVGDASGVQNSASVPPQDNVLACEDICLTELRWQLYAIVGDASGVQHSASVSPQDNDIECENACVSKLYAKSAGHILTSPRARNCREVAGVLR
jgi:predicted lipoprotein with Yx(FWY)xxD motif